MDSISKYIFRQATFVTIFVTVAVSFVIWLSQSLRFVDMVINRGLPVTEFLWLAMLIVPRWLAVILSISSVISVIYIYNRLITDRELIVLRSAGFSNLRLARPAILLALAVALFVYLLNIYLLPVSYRQFKELQLAIRSDYSSVLLQEGAFHTLPNRVTVFIRDRGGEGLLNGIIVHDGRDENSPVTLMAESGRLVETDDGPRVVLLNGNRQQRDSETGAITFLSFEKYTIDLSVTSTGLRKGRRRNPEEMFLWELFSPPAEAGKKATAYIAEGHGRIASPFLGLAFILPALAVLLSGDFSRRGQSDRVVLAVLIFFGILASSIAVRNFAGGNAHGIPLLYANVVVPILIGFYVLGPGTARRRRRRPAKAPAGAG